MSKVIEADLSDVKTLADLESKVDDGELSTDDVRYLFDRGMLPTKVMRAIDSQLGYEQPDPAARLAQVKNTGDVSVASVDDDTMLDENYADMSHKSLQAEAKRRNLSGSGTKEEIIQRLVDDDIDSGGSEA